MVDQAWVEHYTANTLPSRDYANAMAVDSSGNVMLKMGDATIALSKVTGVTEGTGMTSTELSAWGTVTGYLSDLVSDVDSIKSASESTAS